MILCAILFAIGIAVIVVADKHNKDGWVILGGAAAMAFSIAFFVGFATWVKTQGEYGEMIGTQKSILVVESSIRATYEAYYKDSGKVGLGVDLPNMRQSTNLTDAIADYKDMIIEHNRRVEFYRSMRSGWITRMFYPSIPKELNTIEVASFGKEK